MKSKQDDLSAAFRLLPGVDEVLRMARVGKLAARTGKDEATGLVRRALDGLRREISEGAIDATALAERDPALMRRFLTEHSVHSAERLFETWRDLAGFILTKHNDGYVNDLARRPRGVGYSEEWLRRVVDERGDALRVDDIAR